MGALWNRWDLCEFQSHLSGCMFFFTANSCTAIVAICCHGVKVPFVPMSNLFFLVGTTIGERLLYPLSVGWALLLAGFGAHSKGTRIGGCLKWASFSLLVSWRLLWDWLSFR